MIKRLLKRSYTANVGWYVWRHVRRIVYASRHALPASGGGYSGGSPEDAARRALKYALEYRRRLPAEQLARLDFVVEAGVGDSLAMCLLWIGFGARTVWGFDAYRDPRRPERERQIFEALAKLVPEEEAHRIREVVDPTREGLEVDPERLRYVENASTERILETLPAGTVDFLYSMALLEHVRDLEASLRSLFAALRPGGRMIHCVDLRNHTVLEEFGEQAFLRPSPLVWKWMGGDSGLHNRQPLARYREVLRGCGAEFSIETDPELESESPIAHAAPPALGERVFWLHAVRPHEAAGTGQERGSAAGGARP
jgi:SAM-dependent methyltransferase